MRPARVQSEPSRPHVFRAYQVSAEAWCREGRGWNLPLWFRLDLLPSDVYHSRRRTLYVSPSPMAELCDRMQSLLIASDFTYAAYLRLFNVTFLNTPDGPKPAPSFMSFLENGASAKVQKDVFENLSAVAHARHPRPKVLQIRRLAFSLKGVTLVDMLRVLQDSTRATPSLTNEDAIAMSDRELLKAINTLFAAYSPRDILYHTTWWLLQLMGPLSSASRWPRTFWLDPGHVTSHSPITQAIAVSVAALRPPFYYAEAQLPMLYGGLGFLYAREMFRMLSSTAELLNGMGGWQRRLVAPSGSGEEAALWESFFSCPHSVDKGALYPELPALHVAYEAYTRFGNYSSDVPLAGLEGYGPEQVFFLTFCHATCEVDSSGRLTSRYCSAAAKNFGPFATAFSCPRGSEMNIDESVLHARPPAPHQQPLDGELELGKLSKRPTLECELHQLAVAKIYSRLREYLLVFPDGKHKPLPALTRRQQRGLAMPKLNGLIDKQTRRPHGPARPQRSGRKDKRTPS
ncbi:hypothetical protein HPB52_024639 [Rhipicephalus sanguineus]|uniref:Uncharacterized protein n=1 Tax=Rhipicephalus sanguineus TaxID=34632 RepID=A0A9D4TE15_RHISA|nr:hypothetical protein HPB52_024639 [Rhipicephalus sanguineus]